MAHRAFFGKSGFGIFTSQSGRFGSSLSILMGSPAGQQNKHGSMHGAMTQMMHPALHSTPLSFVRSQHSLRRPSFIVYVALTALWGSACCLWSLVSAGLPDSRAPSIPVPEAHISPFPSAR